MKTKIVFKLLIAVFISVAFTTQLTAQKLNKDREISNMSNFSKAKKIRNLGIWIHNCMFLCAYI